MTREVYLGFITFLIVLAGVIIPIASIAGARPGNASPGSPTCDSGPENRALYIERFTDLSLLFGAHRNVTDVPQRDDRSIRAIRNVTPTRPRWIELPVAA